MGGGHSAHPRFPCNTMTIHDIDKIDERLDDLLIENEKQKFPWFISFGLNLLDKGIQKYYFTKIQEDMKPETFSNSISLKQSFVVVVILHIAAIGGIAFMSSNNKAMAKEADKVYVGQPFPAPPMDSMPKKFSPPTPTPSSTSSKPKQSDSAWPTPKPNEKYTKHYVVRVGDTFNGIVRRYKLNPDKLKKINNIKDENKLVVGQVLKLM